MLQLAEQFRGGRVSLVTIFAQTLQHDPYNVGRNVLTMLAAEIAGTGLNQIDRLVVGGSALLNGTLDIDLEGGFVPALGNNLRPLLAATAGVVGQFSRVLQPAGMSSST